MKIVRVVYNLGEYKMWVLCSYQDIRRNIQFTWKERDIMDIPPENWVETVRCEIEDAFSKAKKPGPLF